jgi:gliding motility-associated-like protein
MKKNIFFLILVFLISDLVSAQDSCYNMDFETGTFVGWEGGTGQCCPVDVLKFGIVRNRHTIMKGKGVDANTCDKITVVAPGGMYSARLGNDNIGKEVETLSYTLDVNESNALFVYKYAVVLQDPGHKPEEQPYFKVSVFNENRELIDPLCGSYSVIATSNLPGFEKCPTNNVVYKDWTTVGLNLSAYIGKNIIIEFETGDCTLGGHFGYAYVDAYCSSLKINATYCANANGTILSAPIGFAYLWETGETTQTIKIDNPIDGKKYFCELTSATGCKVDISTLITFQEPIINFEASGTCDKSDVFFVNTTTNTDNSTNTFHWDFGDGTTSDLENPKHQYASKGDYDVHFSFSNSLGCSYSKARTIKINPNPEPHLTDGIICSDSSGNTVQTYTLDTGLPSDGFSYRWFLNDKLLGDATESTYAASQKGKYSVTAINNSTYCTGEASAMVESIQMPSDIVIKLSDAFADKSFVNVEVIGGTGPFMFQLDDLQFQDSNVFSDLSFGEHLITVKDNSNCTLIAKQINILGYPKFFTPNNDGYNDYWNIPNYKNLLQAQISIFDRYGKLLKEISPLNIGWDGYHNGTLMPATDYWFTLNYKEIDENGESKSKVFQSHFSLKR